MDELVWKIRISVLWLIMGAGFSGVMILQMFVPCLINNFIAGEIEGMEITNGLLLVMSLFWIVFFIDGIPYIDSKRSCKSLY